MLKAESQCSQSKSTDQSGIVTGWEFVKGSLWAEVEAQHRGCVQKEAEQALLPKQAEIPEISCLSVAPGTSLWFAEHQSCE